MVARTRVPKLPKMVLNMFLHQLILDSFDERILAALSDGKPKVHIQMLG